MHVDDWLDTPPADEAEAYAKRALEVARLPAAEKMRLTEAERHQPLFCDFRGTRYRCIGASRLGDVWLTTKFDATHGYELRVDVAECSGWAAASNALGRAGRRDSAP